MSKKAILAISSSITRRHLLKCCLVLFYKNVRPHKTIFASYRFSSKNNTRRRLFSNKKTKPEVIIDLLVEETDEDNIGTRRRVLEDKISLAKEKAGKIPIEWISCMAVFDSE